MPGTGSPKILPVIPDMGDLSPEELAKFRARFVELDHVLWDRQIESDANSGKLDQLVKKALADFKAGKARKI
jgi:hypothetical protein